MPDLYRRLCSWENLVLAWKKARKGKRGGAAAASFDFVAGEELLALEEELVADRYVPGAYQSFTIHDPKRRLISAAPFRDRVVHHALCNVLEPIFERRFIAHSYANRRGKGTHAALARCQALSRGHRYFLLCDVEHFFAAIDHQVLLDLIARKVKDREVLSLCSRILAGGAEVHRDAYEAQLFPGDDLISALRPRGLPIGNLTSQFWANVYLDPLDQLVKRRLRCSGYLRYVDDFVLFGNCKAELWAWRSEIVRKLAALRLTLHEAACQPRPVAEGISFLGWVVRTSSMRLKRRKVVAYRRRLLGLVGRYHARELSWNELWASIRGWATHARFGNTAALRRQVLGQVVLKPHKGAQDDKPQ